MALILCLQKVNNKFTKNGLLLTLNLHWRILSAIRA
jgi:hypothetical protein